MALRTIDDATLLKSLLEVFRTHGYEGSTIAQLSEATGLKKSSLYHRFPNGKDDMVKAVVLYVGSLIQQNVIAPLLETDKTPQQRFATMKDTLRTFYADGEKNCLINVLTLGEKNAEVTELLHKGYSDWVAALTQLAQSAGISQAEAEARSQRFLVMLEGALVIQRLTNKPETLLQCMDQQQAEFFLPEKDTAIS